MEYVEGVDLATLVCEQGPLPLDQALDCILQAARGLQYAHQHGVVHRDVKPANLVLECGDLSPLSDRARNRPAGLIGREERDEPKSQLAARDPTSDNSDDKSSHSQGRIQILDMGLAHLDSADAAQDELTAVGQIMGTVNYMAPEQAIDAHQPTGGPTSTAWRPRCGTC